MHFANVILGSLSVMLAGCHTQKMAPQPTDGEESIPPQPVEEYTPPQPDPPVCKYGVPMEIYERPMRKYGVPNVSEQ